MYKYCNPIHKNGNTFKLKFKKEKKEKKKIIRKNHWRHWFLMIIYEMQMNKKLKYQ